MVSRRASVSSGGISPPPGRVSVGVEKHAKVCDEDGRAPLPPSAESDEAWGRASVLGQDLKSSALAAVASRLLIHAELSGSATPKEIQAELANALPHGVPVRGHTGSSPPRSLRRQALSPSHCTEALANIGRDMARIFEIVLAPNPNST